jgi:hypothetical protein
LNCLNSGQLQDIRVEQPSGPEFHYGGFHIAPCRSLHEQGAYVYFKWIPCRPPALRPEFIEQRIVDLIEADHR